MRTRIGWVGLLISSIGALLVLAWFWVGGAQGVPILGFPPHPGSLRLRAGDVATFHNDNLRTGANLAEFSLTPDRVKTRDAEGKPLFKEDFCWKVDGKVFAQPLYVRAVETPSGRHNLVFIATTRNSVYAFDPDDRKHVEPDFPQASPASCRGVVNGDVPAARVWKWEGRQPSVGLAPAVDFPFGSQAVLDTGIISTPVIDVDAGRIYFVTRSGAGCKTPVAGDGEPVSNDLLCRFHLLSLDIGTGAEMSRTLVDADITDHKTGRSFAFRSMAGAQRNRSALLLAGGLVYVAFGAADSSPGDAECHEFHGWVMGYDTRTLGPTSKPSKLWVSTPGWFQGGIWQGTNGLAADDNALYLMTANTVHPAAVAAAPGCGASLDTKTGGAVRTNGSPLIVPPSETFNSPADLFDSDPTHAGYIDSFVALDLRSEASGLMRVAGAFSQTDTKPGLAKSRFWCRTQLDWDVGSSGPVLLPDDRLIGGGKDGVLQLLKRSSMALMTSTDLGPPLVRTPAEDPEGCYAYHTARGIFGAPVFWRAQDPGTKTLREFVYLWPTAESVVAEGAVLMRYQLDGATLTPAPLTDEMKAIGQGAVNFNIGGILSLSANGARADTGILWANLEFRDAGRTAHRLYAFNASSLQEVWHWQFDPLDSSRAPDGSFKTQTSYARHSSPTIAGGRVFLAGMEPFDAAEHGQDGRVHVFSYDPPALTPCRPSPAACRGRSCGNVDDDGCGHSLNCGNCGAEQVCVEGRCTGARGCCPPSCPRGTFCPPDLCRCVLLTP
jgi:outer membrane protein assembly factor BamB